MFFNPEREGWLKKEGQCFWWLHCGLGTHSNLPRATLLTSFPTGGSKKNWRQRWVVVKDNCLYYFKGNEDESPCGIVPLSNVEARLMEAEHR